ncbi:MAG: leucine-rich repeat protein, partial [Clostridia bacterium]
PTDASPNAQVSTIQANNRDIYNLPCEATGTNGTTKYLLSWYSDPQHTNQVPYNNYTPSTPQTLYAKTSVNQLFAPAPENCILSANGSEVAPVNGMVFQLDPANAGYAQGTQNSKEKLNQLSNVKASTYASVPQGITIIKLNTNGLTNFALQPQITVNVGGTPTTYRITGFSAGNNLIANIELPYGLISINNYAFNGCTALKSITIPSSVTSIGDNAFSGCTALINANKTNGIFKLKDTANQYWIIKADTTIKTADLTGAKGIVGYAFNGCSSLTSVTIPYSVISIGVSAFGETSNYYAGCTALTSMTIGDAQNGSALASVGMHAFIFQNSAECTLTYYGTDAKFLSLTNYSADSGTAFSSSPSLHNSSIKLVIIDGDKTIYKNIISYCDCILNGTMVQVVEYYTDKKGRKRKRIKTKKIEDITYDDLLLVWNFDKGKFDQAKPLWIAREKVAKRYTHVKFSDGSELNIVGQDDSKRHRIFNVETGKFEYVGAKGTPVGTTTFNSKGEFVKVVSLEFVDKTVKYQNIITNYYSNLFANGILTSHSSSNVYPIKDMKYVKDGRKKLPMSEFDGIEEKWVKGLRLDEQILTNGKLQDGRMIGSWKEYIQKFKDTMRK